MTGGMARRPWWQFLPAESDFATTASRLAAAAASNPLRRRVQAGVDRRFNRSSYDAGRTVEEFSHELRGASEADELASELQRVTAFVMQPAHVSLWTGSRS